MVTICFVECKWSVVYFGSTGANRSAYQFPGEIVPILCPSFWGVLSPPQSFLGRFACENNLPSLMENSTYLFADDTKIIGSQMNLFSLQNDLNKAIKWSKENRMQFNNAKFEAICFDVKKLDQCSVHLYADDTEITCKSSVNDLGVVITNNLKWDSHINQRLSKAQQKLFS